LTSSASSAGTTIYVHLGSKAAVLAGIITIKVDRVVGLINTLDFSIVDDFKDFLESQDDLLQCSLDSHASVCTLWSAGLVHFDIGSRGISDLFNLESGTSNNATNNRLVYKETGFKGSFTAFLLAALGMATFDCFFCQHGYCMLEDIGNDARFVGMDGHDTFGSRAIGNPNICVKLCAKFLDILATLSNDTAGTFTWDEKAHLELVAPMSLASSSSGSRARSALIVAAFHVLALLKLKWWKMGQIEWDN
jgi:hypothetical protein